VSTSLPSKKKGNPFCPATREATLALRELIPSSVFYPGVELKNDTIGYGKESSTRLLFLSRAYL